MGLRITGKLPDARYMSFNLYLHKTRQSVGSLVDTEIHSRDRKYAVWILPEEAPSKGLDNLRFSYAQGRYSVFLRYYDPNGDPYGKVDLPEIQAIDLRTGQVVPLPRVRFNLLSSKILPRIFTTFLGWINRGKPYRNQGAGKIYAYRHSGKGFFPNHDNHYLFMALQKKRDEVIVIRLKPPTFARNMWDTRGQVRYWSVALCTPETETHATLMDKEAKIHSDGFLYLAIGAEEKQVENSVWNILPWTAAGKKAVLIYRHLLTDPDYPHAMWNAQAFSLYDSNRVPASVYLKDHAPIGKVISKQVFDQHWPKVFWDEVLTEAR